MKSTPHRSTIRSHPVFRGLLLLAVFLSCLVAPDSGQAARPSKEYEVKAAFLLNFVQYIDWPTTAFADAKSPIAIGVLGDDPFGSALDQTFQGESAHGRSFVIKRSRSVDDLKSCHLLFISKSEKDKVDDILSSLNTTTLATVSEFDGFARRGGLINFYLEGKKIRFEINTNAAQSKDLKVSSELLKRARIVDGGKGRN
jgi:hypothetical protein